MSTASVREFFKKVGGGIATVFENISGEPEIASTANPLPVAIVSGGGGGGGGGDASAANQTLQIAKETDIATNTANILAKIIASPATAANQSTEITALGSLLTELQKKTDRTDTQRVSIAEYLIDAFGRMKVSEPESLFDAQFTYDLHPLLFEQITNGTGASIAHDATNRNAVMTFNSTATGGKAYMQSYECIRYQPGKSQNVRITFNFKEQVSNCLKFARLSDGINGYSFENTGALNRFVIYSGTATGNLIANQVDWNIDKLPSLDITKINHCVIDFQALYVGRVRFGFDIAGRVVWCHEFDTANVLTNQYIQSANLPIQVGMTCTGTVVTTMIFICCAVMSEGGQENQSGYEFLAESSVTAASGVNTHAISLRPKLTFNGITNRVKIGFLEINVSVTGNNPVDWYLVAGQAITGGAWANVNATYSATEYSATGTVSGSPAIIIDGGNVPSSNSVKGTAQMSISQKYPMTLDAAGLQRLLGTLSILVKGVGGASACNVKVKFVEVR